MFKRKIEEELQKWKESLKIKKKAFVLKGLRQVGKTFIVQKFARENYKNVIYINFKVEVEMRDCFSYNLVVDELITNISSKKKDAIFIPHQTVIIFDEIQECSAARASIKPFMEDGRFDVIATGSLLGIRGYNSKYSGGVPVGFERIVYMKPMDFEEFLWAIKINDNVINYLKDCYKNRTVISKATHEAMLHYFRQYMCVGGMPAVVKMFLKTRDMNQVLQEQKDILENYRDDFAKHLDENEREQTDKELLTKINRVFDSIPSQLAKENKKFMVSKIDKKSSLEKYEDAIKWLVDYGLISLCYNLHTPEFPLEGNKISNIFKIYVNDTGLLMAMLDNGSQAEILMNSMGTFKGEIYENIIADAFSKNDRKLYYFSKNSGLEIDFITNYNREITLIEVKAKNGNTKSSKEVMSNKIKYPEVKRVIKLKDCNIGETENILSIPYYLAFLLKDELIDIKL